jgi:hypothetical protein
MSKIWIDPPSGWRYGFPKIYSEAVEGPFYSWLVREGYPQAEIDSFGNNFWCRQWNVEPTEEDEE